MTTPAEEVLALMHARAFLFDLLDSRATPRVPRAVRERARACLRHYPLLPAQQDVSTLLERAWAVGGAPKRGGSRA